MPMHKMGFDYLERDHLISEFLKDNPTPNDEQVEAFAVELKAKVYSKTTILADVGNIVRRRIFWRSKAKLCP